MTQYWICDEITCFHVTPNFEAAKRIGLDRQTAFPRRTVHIETWDADPTDPKALIPKHSQITRLDPETRTWSRWEDL